MGTRRTERAKATIVDGRGYSRLVYQSMGRKGLTPCHLQDSRPYNAGRGTVTENHGPRTYGNTHREHMEASDLAPLFGNEE